MAKRRAYNKTAFQGLVSGSPGQGKTTLVNQIARDRRVIAFDPNGEYEARGFHVVRSIEFLRRAVVKGWRDGYRISLKPSDPLGDLQLLSDFLAKMQRPYLETPDGRVPPQPKVLLIIEEMQLSYPRHMTGGDFFATEICGRRRHYGIDVLGVTLKPSMVSAIFRGTCDIHYFFAHYDHVDKRTLREMVGPEHGARIDQLQPHEYMRRFRGQVTYHRNPL